MRYMPPRQMHTYTFKVVFFGKEIKAFQHFCLTPTQRMHTKLIKKIIIHIYFHICVKNLLLIRVDVPLAAHPLLKKSHSLNR